MARTHGGGRFVDCPRRGGRRKPNIVYFGENLPEAQVEQAYSMVDDAEAPIAIVNRGRTRGGLATVRADGG
ncbi:MAG: hypothetical protein JO259_05045 [Mycobacterium sp.]|nr:hypothetical protein [Mycobacterium sp.]